MYGIYIKTYGCQMNVYDSGFMASILKPLGYAIVKNISDADVIILNTCNIREKAGEGKLYSELGQISQLKKNNDATVVVAGCVSQGEGSDIFKRAPCVDIVVGPQSLADLPGLILKKQKEKGKFISVEFPIISKFDAVGYDVVPEQGKLSAFVSIQEGCDKFCTYCVVPYTRGPEYSRPAAKILDEAKALVESGTKEIVLLGQNVNAYKDSCGGKTIFLGDLISDVAKIPGLLRVSYMTSHPNDMHDSLYEAHAHEEKLLPYIHLPIQSGSDKILRLMNRRHSVKKYIEVIDKIRSLKPDIAVSGDFIVGFPEETEEDFENTMEIASKIKYAKAYSFTYSPRPGTPAATKDQIEESIKRKRLIGLQDLLNRTQLDYNKNFIGSVIPVLLSDKKGRHEGQMIGKSMYMQSVVCVDSEHEVAGQVIDVAINDATKNCLTGTVVR